MPGVYHLSLDQLLLELQKLHVLGLNKIMLFGMPAVKDELGSGTFQKDDIIQRATRLMKENYPNFLVIADTCICQYTTDSHCGLLQDGVIVNAASLEIHNQVALSQAIAGVDIVAPASMMDGFVASIRATLDNHGFEHTPIMSYGIKYSSAFYGSFRDEQQVVAETFLGMFRAGADAIITYSTKDCAKWLHNSRAM
ncbi:hypothetical protein ACIQVU_05385 [Lysinibacillus sp. NPDC098008]|uniref:hypothetical protein n=1 Tax=Lysinibacillus sp. NPDC098008 TaxID=3364146 RepID=UPI00380B916C